MTHCGNSGSYLGSPGRFGQLQIESEFDATFRPTVDAAAASGGFRQFCTNCVAPGMRRADRTRSWLSKAYMFAPIAIWRMLPRHRARLPFSLARERAGKII